MDNRFDATHDGEYEDTGSFISLEEVSRINTNASSEPIVYGLDINNTDNQKKNDTRTTIRLVAGGVLAAAAIIGGLLVAKPFVDRRASQADEPAQTVEQPKQSQKDEKASEEETPSKEADKAETPDPEPPAEEKAPDAFVLPAQPSTDDLAQQARQLTFDGNDLAISDDQVTVEVLAGHVQVTHSLASTTGLDPHTLASNAARRAAALANAIGSKQVKGTSEEAPAAANDIVWIVRNPSADSYLAVYFPTSGAPTTGDGIEVLAQSPRYRLSDSLYNALGGAVKQDNGETPTLITGEYIWSTAEI